MLLEKTKSILSEYTDTFERLFPQWRTKLFTYIYSIFQQKKTAKTNFGPTIKFISLNILSDYRRKL